MLQPLLESALGVRFVRGNAIKLLRNGVEIFPAMLDAIDRAQHTIELLTFIYWTGDIAERFAAALCDAANRGVEVRVILDAVGAHKMREELLEQMRSSGVEVAWFGIAGKAWQVWRSDRRTHRKVLVVDGCVGFTGGVGIAQEWEGNARDPSEWRETHIEVTGPMALALRGAFFETWFEQSDRVVSTRTMKQHALRASGEERPGPLPVRDCLAACIRSRPRAAWSDIEMLFEVAVGCAEERVDIVTPYFLPSERVMDLMCRKVAEGVGVRVLVPGEHIDHDVSKLAADDVLEPLLHAGVEVHRYLRTMIHAKILLVDDELACVGSCNLNHRSAMRDDEVALAMLDSRIVEELRGHMAEDLVHARQVRPAMLAERTGVLERLGQRIARPFHQLL